MAEPMVRAYRLAEDGRDQDRWVLIHDDRPLKVLIFNGKVAERLAQIIDLGGGDFVKRHVMKRLVFWKERTVTNGDGELDTIKVMDMSRGENGHDTELEQVFEILNKEIDEQIGFDRNVGCPKDGGRGLCDSCPFLTRRDILDHEFNVTEERWSCRLMCDEVKVAELMTAREKNGKR